MPSPDTVFEMRFSFVFPTSTTCICHKLFQANANFYYRKCKISLTDIEIVEKREEFKITFLNRQHQSKKTTLTIAVRIIINGSNWGRVGISWDG